VENKDDLYSLPYLLLYFGSEEAENQFSVGHVDLFIVVQFLWR
jgi:hypothetical protein